MSGRTLSLALVAGALIGAGAITAHGQSVPSAGATRPASAAASAPASAPTSAPTVPAPQVTLAVAVEDHQKILRATVRAGGKPLENVTVAFYVKRTFGDLLLATDQTLDDGTAAIAFPTGLPGGRTGRLAAYAQVQSPEQYAGARGEAALDGGAILPEEPDPFPRALWAPRAPMALIVTVLGLLMAVWVVYGYTVVQLLRIRRKGNAP